MNWNLFVCRQIVLIIEFCWKIECARKMCGCSNFIERTHWSKCHAYAFDRPQSSYTIWKYIFKKGILFEHHFMHQVQCQKSAFIRIKAIDLPDKQNTNKRQRDRKWEREKKTKSTKATKIQFDLGACLYQCLIYQKGQ